jgi:hypothetical protein
MGKRDEAVAERKNDRGSLDSAGTGMVSNTSLPSDQTTDERRANKPSLKR